MSVLIITLSEKSKFCRYHHLTHVPVNDPTAGYGIRIENMLAAVG